MSFVYPAYVRPKTTHPDVKKQEMWEKATAGAGITVPVGRRILNRLIKVEEEYRIDDSVSVLKIVSYVKDNLRPEGTKYLDEEDIQKALKALKPSSPQLASLCCRSVNSVFTKAASSVPQSMFSEHEGSGISTTDKTGQEPDTDIGSEHGSK